MRILVALACIVALVGCASVSSVSAVKGELADIKAVVDAPQTGNAALGQRVGGCEAALFRIGQAVEHVTPPAVVTPAVTPAVPPAVKPSAPVPAASAAPAPKEKPVVKETYHMTLFWIVVLCIVAFVIGVLAKGVFEALEPAMDAKIQNEEMGLLTCIQKAIHVAWAAIFGKKKAAAATPKPVTAGPQVPLATE